ncbi:MAG: hypothetical protein Q9218_008311 [Villophora microphyllina]
MPMLSTGSRTSPPQESLAAEGQAYGWVACTTDEILGTKEHLYDTLITLPPEYGREAETKIWPRIQAGKGVGIRATQRDARRYRGLRRDLRRFRADPTSRPQSRYTDAEPTNNSSANESTANLLPFPSLEEATTTDRDLGSSTTFSPSADDDDSNQQEILEPQSWSALAYNSFIWWASAGEARTDREEESEYDASLLANLDDRSTPGEDAGQQGAVGFEMALIAYFHRFTVLILRTLADVIDVDASEAASSHDASPLASPAPSSSRRATTGGEGEESGGRAGNREDDDEIIEITSEDVSKMGLDPWSESDRVFVEELVGFYWGRRSRVNRMGGVECCGVRIC